MESNFFNNFFNLRLWMEDEIVFEGKVDKNVKPFELLYFKKSFQHFSIVDKTSKRIMKSFDKIEGFLDGELVSNFRLQPSTVSLSMDGFLFFSLDGVWKKSNTLPLCDCKVMKMFRIHTDLESLECGRFSTFESLESLMIYNTKLSSNIGCLTNLKKLTLKNTLLKRDIFKAISKLTNLEFLSLESISVLVIDQKSQSFFSKNLQKLKKFKLLQSPLLRFVDVSTSTQLECLSIQYNELNEKIGNLTKLKKLTLKSFRGERFPKSMVKLEHLKSLTLEPLHPFYLDVDDMKILSKLKKIDFNNYFVDRHLLVPFCEMLKTNQNLKKCRLRVEDIESDIQLFRDAMKENGSVVSGSLLSTSHSLVDYIEEYTERNKLNHQQAKGIVLRMILIRKLNPGLFTIPKEIMQIIAQKLWLTRCDYKSWEMQ